MVLPQALLRDLPARQNKRVMLVEDDPNIAEGMIAALESFGYEVCAAVQTGPDAISKARELAPDVILMDINLKGSMSGVEAAGAITANGPARIIYLTAQASEVVTEQAKLTHHYGYLSKPFDPEELKSVIEASFDDLTLPMG